MLTLLRHKLTAAAVVIVTLILLGRTLEARAKGRTSQAIKRLVGLQAKTARVERNGEEVETVRNGRMRKLHKAFLRYHDPENWPLLRDALRAMGRADSHQNGGGQLAIAFAQNQREEVRIMEVSGALAAEPGMMDTQIRRFLVLHKELDPDDEELTVSFGIQNGEAVAKILSLDYLLVSKARS